jgi:hypothetical protein
MRGRLVDVAEANSWRSKCVQDVVHDLCAGRNLFISGFPVRSIRSTRHYAFVTATVIVVVSV